MSPKKEEVDLRPLLQRNIVLDDLREEWKDCEDCDLCQDRISVVFGEGNPAADIMIIGEAPGEEEDISGRPFVGASGEVLEGFLKAVGIDRKHDLFITNIVACRPFTTNKDDKGKIRTENRQPSKVEREACWPRVYQTIYMVDPWLIIAMGRPSVAMLLRQGAKMANVQGRIMPMQFEGIHVPITYAVMPMYHPSFLLRNQNKAPEGPWDKTAQNFAEVCMILDHLREIYRGEIPPDRGG